MVKENVVKINSIFRMMELQKKLIIEKNKI